MRTIQYHWRIHFLTALLVVGSISLSLGAEPSEYILANGMKVLLVEVPKAPVATVQVWYKVGSRNEVMGRAGLSHMLEHEQHNLVSVLMWMKDQVHLVMVMVLVPW